MGFICKTRVVSPGFAVTSQLAFCDAVAELGLDNYNLLLSRIVGGWKVDLDVDSVLLDIEFRSFK